jgi:hypothetical protein
MSVLDVPTDLGRFKRPALIVAHPGHEVSVFGWLSAARPHVCIFTDGSGMSSASRLASSRALLGGVGASPGEVFGVGPDTTFYQAILSGDAAFFLDLVDRLASALVRHEADLVAGDASEGYDPNHDVCRVAIDAAVTIAERRLRRPIANYEFAFGDWLLPGSRRHDAACLHVELGDALLHRKLAAARRFAGLDAEVERALAAVGEDFFRVECFRPASASASRMTSDKPYYETVGEQRLAAGSVASVIRYTEHVAPLAAAIHLHAEAAEPLRSPRG